MKLKSVLFTAALATVTAAMLLTLAVPQAAEAAPKVQSYLVGCSSIGQWFTSDPYTRHDAAQLCGSTYYYAYPYWCAIDSVTPVSGGRDLCH